MHDLRLLIVADDPLVATGLTRLLGDLPGCDVSGQVTSRDFGSELGALDDPAVDIILWDLGWEFLDSLPEWLDTPLPIVALMGDELHATELWNAGIRALLRRDTPATKMWNAVRAASQGFVVLDPQWVPLLIPTATFSEINLSEELTRRESEVLQLLAEGLTNKAIAQRLAISDHTVKFHVNAILGKLGAQSRTEAVVQATRAGFISL